LFWGFYFGFNGNMLKCKVGSQVFDFLEFRKKTSILPVNLNMKISGILLICLFFHLALSSCNRDKEAIVQEKVAERVEVFVRKKREDCREALMQQAERTVDSLLLAEAQSALSDSLARSRPGRPFQPAPVPPIDSLKVQPIFSDTPVGGE
jgi:hypothetical protein